MKPRLLRPVEPPLGLYFRPGRNDHQKMLDLIAEDQLAFSGLVLDACLTGRHSELRAEAAGRDLEAVLDSRCAELATEGGFLRSGVSELPWASEAMHTPEALAGQGGAAVVDAIAEHVEHHGFNAALAPTHLLQEEDDPWFEVDVALTRELRRNLNRRGLAQTPIYYPLSITSGMFRDDDTRARLSKELRGLPIDALWLRVSPFGATSGPLALRRYIEACRDLHELSVPLVAEHTGAAGVALLAFGAVGGIESGITFGERFDARPPLRRPSHGTPFAPQPRVYIRELGAFLTRAQAATFFERQQMKTVFGYKSDRCCRRGWADMLSDPRRHFTLRRAAEVAEVSRAPSTLRPQNYLDRFLRPATDLALRASRVEPALKVPQRRLEGWRVTLGAMVANGYIAPSAQVPEGRRMIDRLGA
jgi:hypothetical protein